ncbi:MAG: hypothetical protein QHJ73_18060, partial [Armatimonadota bacterium]|nr:hypothetical protein [Armatimonadota bacterium]
VRHFDVCLIPFRMNELTRGVNPVKLFEYFAMGKSVVSAPLPDVLAYERLCVVVPDSPGALVEGIARALAERQNAARSRQLAAERMAVARQSTWAARVSAVSELIAHALAIRSKRP